MVGFAAAGLRLGIVRLCQASGPGCWNSRPDGIWAFSTVSISGRIWADVVFWGFAAADGLWLGDWVVCLPAGLVAGWLLAGSIGNVYPGIMGFGDICTSNCKLLL